MTDDKCRTDCKCYIQDGECSDGVITVLGSQFYDDCLLRIKDEEWRKRLRTESEGEDEEE